MKRKIFILLVILMLLFLYNIKKDTLIIPNSAIRLRIIPNSNEPNDIYIKGKVKDYLEKNVYSITKNILSKEKASQIILNNLPKIDKDIQELFIKNQYNLPYQVNYGSNYFPQKVYKGNIYPEGYYESLVISIGEAKGDNFWCVLFPNLCLIDKQETKQKKSFFKELFKKIF